MKLADIVEQISVDPRKLTDYALNFEAPWGRHKALVFKQALGFTQQNYADLLTQIKQQAMETEATFHSKDEFGERYTVDLIVQGTMNGEVWCVPVGSSGADRIKPAW